MNILDQSLRRTSNKHRGRNCSGVGSDSFGIGSSHLHCHDGGIVLSSDVHIACRESYTVLWMCSGHDFIIPYVRPDIPPDESTEAMFTCSIYSLYVGVRIISCWKTASRGDGVGRFEIASQSSDASPIGIFWAAAIAMKSVSDCRASGHFCSAAPGCDWNHVTKLSRKISVRRPGAEILSPSKRMSSIGYTCRWFLSIDFFFF